jgi:DNA-binding protein HU-beta
MTKAEVIAEIVNKTGIDKNMVSESLETFFKVVKTSMTDGKNLYFRGFGSFIVKKRAKKIARNISKNTAIEIPEHFIPSFKPAKTFSDKVKKNAKPIAKAPRKKSK